MNSYTTITVETEVAVETENLRKKLGFKKKSDVIKYAYKNLRNTEINTKRKLIDEISNELSKTLSPIKLKKKIKLSDIKVEDAYLDEY